MRAHRLMSCIAVGASLALAAPVVAASGDGGTTAILTRASTVSFVQPCGGTSWFGGTTDVCNGTVVYRDYVYDDEGADTGGLGYDTQNTQNAFGTLAMPAGDVRYPTTDINTADIVSLQLQRSGNRVQVTALLNVLFHPASTILAVAVDTDDKASTGGGSWGGLGIASTGWDKLYEFGVGNVRTNTITGSFPLPASPVWRVQAVTAQAATNTVMNVAFRGPDEHAAYKLDYTNPSPYPPTGQGAWFEDDQAAALKAGDISRFGEVVDTSWLRPGVTRLQHVGPGLHERVYTSRYTLPPGEGMSYAGIDGRGDGGSVPAFNQVFNFLGRYQPYAVYIPPHAGPYGLQMEWHGSNQGLTGQINQPGMQARFGDALNRLLVVPEARGPNGYGSDISERDLLDVMNDVEAYFPVDRSRVFSSGYSQGGYITYRMAMLYPDRFAGYTSWVGFTGDDLNGTPAAGSALSVKAGAVGNMLDYVGNLRNVPGSLLFSGEDELVQVPSSTAMDRALAATDDVYTWWLHNPADHFTYALLDDWTKEAAVSATQRLVTRPVRVTYSTDPTLDAPQYGIVHDRAYWVSGIRTRAAGQGTVDLTDPGCGGTVPVTTTGNGAGTDPVPWVSDFRAQTGVRRVAAAATITGSLTNVSTATVDAHSTCLTGKRVAVDVTTDGPATLRLSDGRIIRFAAAGRHLVTVAA